MNIELARAMVRTAFEANRSLQAILPRLKTELPEADYKAAAHDVAVAIDQVNTALLARAVAVADINRHAGVTLRMGGSLFGIAARDQRPCGLIDGRTLGHVVEA